MPPSKGNHKSHLCQLMQSVKFRAKYGFWQLTVHYFDIMSKIEGLGLQNNDDTQPVQNGAVGVLL